VENEFSLQEIEAFAVQPASQRGIRVILINEWISHSKSYFWNVTLVAIASSEVQFTFAYYSNLVT
jgi:hypothetical protein